MLGDEVHWRLSLPSNVFRQVSLDGVSVGKLHYLLRECEAAISISFHRTRPLD